MATRRLDMARTKEILRLKWEKGLSHRQIARSLGVSLGVVGAMASRAKRVGLALPDLEKLDESALEKRLYGGMRGKWLGKPRAKLPDPLWVDQELRRSGVTLELLHLEYLQEHPAGYRYTTYCNHYREWKKRQSPSMRQTHRAGEKLFVDYSGKKPRVVARETGGVRPRPTAEAKRQIKSRSCSANSSALDTWSTEKREFGPVSIDGQTSGAAN